MKNLFSLILVSALALIACTVNAEPGYQSPYVYTYSGDPSNVSTNMINPALGSAVIDPTTGNRYLKASAKGDNSTYGTCEFILSGTSVDISGTVAVTSAAVTLPANAGKFALTSADIIVVTSTTTTTAPAVAIYSGSTTALTGTTTLTALTGTNTYTHISANTLGSIIDTGTTGATVNLKVITTGTSANLNVKPILRLYRVPAL